MSRLGIMMALLVSLVIAAEANAQPRYNVEAHCEELANFGGSYSAVMENACIKQEQSAYDALTADWHSLPAEARSHCDEIARFGGKGSYTMLQACIQQEVQARASRPTFRR